MSIGGDIDQLGFDDKDWSFEGCRRRLRSATAIIMELERGYDRSAQRAADAEGVYRHSLAKAMRGYREQGKAVEESLTQARADVATLSRERDYARDLVKLASEKLEDARDSRRALWRMVEWARGRDLAQQGHDEREPSSSWP